MKKKKPAKRSVERAPLTEAAKRRIATSVTIVLSVAAVAFTGFYVFANLNDLDNPAPVEGGTTARVDSVRDEMLEAALLKNDARRSPEQAIPDDLPNPFAVIAPPPSVPVSAPESVAPAPEPAQ